MNIKQRSEGFSLIELLVAMTVMLSLLALVSTILVGALNTRKRESRRTDALSSAQAALNVISREVANSGYGLSNNGLVVADTALRKIRVRANLINVNNCTTERGEDVMYFYDATTESIVRSERYATAVCGTNFETKTSVVVNRISDIKFQFFDYTGSNSTPTETTAPTENTGRVRITVEVKLENVQGQPTNQKVILQSDVTLRNSEYMLNQY